MVELHVVKHRIVDVPAALHVSLGIELGRRLADPGAEGRSSGQGSVDQRLQLSTGRGHLQSRVDAIRNIKRGASAENAC